MDRTADPCHDFFQYACGSWNRKHVIPEDRSSISTFEVMADQLQVVLKGEFWKNSDFRRGSYGNTGCGVFKGEIQN